MSLASRWTTSLKVGLDVGQAEVVLGYKIKAFILLLTSLSVLNKKS